MNRDTLDRCIPPRPMGPRRMRAGLVLAVFLSLSLVSACGNDDLVDRQYQDDSGVSDEPHGVTVSTPEGIGATTDEGTPIPCAGCHTMHAAYPYAQTTADLKDFHKTVEVTHGDLTCLSCHDVENRGQLRLADGRTVPLESAMTLCAQCHGTQYRDYQRGSHGGMSGHWDLETGGRTRRHCMDCHAAHDPAYLNYQPVFKPRDRFLEAH